MPIIEVENVSKSFRAARGARALLGRGGLAERFLRRPPETIQALDSVSFTVGKGESLGIIGANGSGKSTLLKIIAGVTVPTSGTVNVRGHVASLLELGAGFHPMLTGRENVYLNAGLHGMRHAQVDAIFDQVLEFSGIGKFIDYPIDTYSSGMYVRLGFAVAAFTNPDIFLIDEVLSVGDEEFQRRCRRRIGELMEQGKTIVFVSHDLAIVNTICDRVILLSRGSMILRDTSSNAIDFYLRQVGAEKGMHTIAHGPLEAIVCNGRISVFHDQNEVTAPQGLQVQVYNLGRWQSSLDAEWVIVERGETRCVAHGHLTKLNAVIVWSVEVEDGMVRWSVALECTTALEAERLEILMFFPTAYVDWSYDEYTGSFPELLPEHTQWHPAMDPDLLCERATLLPRDGSERAPVVVDAGDHRPNLRGSWANTDYMTGCRVLKIEEHLGEASGALAAGRHDLLDVHVRVGGSRDAIAKGLGDRRRKHAVEAGAMTARFDRGSVRISHGGTQITEAWHLYTSVQIGHLWNDSTGYRWESFERDGDRIRVAGSSRRFPFRQEWELSALDGGIGIEIWIEALEALQLQETHTSIMLVPGYTAWETEHETGGFPEISREAHDWVHLNKDYAPGAFVSASGNGVPALRFESAAEDLPVRMTVLNSSYFEQSRVLQALRPPEHGMLHVEPGRHLYFRGRVTLS